MNSTAMLPRLHPPTSVEARRPTLFIAGAPYPAATCVRLIAHGLLDEREAIVSLERFDDPISRAGAEQALRLLGAAAELRWLLRVGDHGQHEERLLSGRLVELDTRLDESACGIRYRLRDRWSLVLDEVVRSSWWAGSAGGAFERNLSAVTRLAPRANRSHQRHIVKGRSTYVFQEGGVPWRLFDLLVYLSVTLDLNLQQNLIPDDLLYRELSGEIRAHGPIRSILTSLLAMSGLQLDRRQGAESGRAGHRLRPLDKGRPIGLSLTDRARARSLIERFEARLRREQAANLLGSSKSTQLAGTFTLQGNWDSALQEGPSESYDRGHAEFLQHAEVFRRWRVAATDPQLADLLQEGPAPRTAPRFRPRRDGGRCDPTTGVLVEYSLDDGQSWHDYTDDLTLSARRAELYLEAPSLPPGFAAAGSAGSLQLRLSASMRRDDVTPLRRILGNLFLCDQDDADADGQSDSHDTLDTLPHESDSDPDDDDLPLAGHQDLLEEPKHDEPDDDDDVKPDVITLDPQSISVGQPLRLGATGSIEVTLGPVDPGLQVGDLVTKVRGGLSPSIYLEHTTRLRIERVEHDLNGRQQTRLSLVPVRQVR